MTSTSKKYLVLTMINSSGFLVLFEEAQLSHDGKHQTVKATFYEIIWAEILRPRTHVARYLKKQIFYVFFHSYENLIIFENCISVDEDLYENDVIIENRRGKKNVFINTQQHVHMTLDFFFFKSV